MNRENQPLVSTEYLTKGKNVSATSNILGEFPNKAHKICHMDNCTLSKFKYNLKEKTQNNNKITKKG